MNNFNQILTNNTFNFVLTIDCEGPNFDKNLEQNVLHLEKLLKLTTENQIYTVLFITPYFAEMLHKLNLIPTIKEKYKVIFGLHVHPNNLPDVIEKKCSFIKKEENLLAAYSYDEQKIILTESINYLTEKGIAPIECFRGGYFSINDDTEKILKEISAIQWESHNVYREEYMVTVPLLASLPVYASDKETEFRLEYFESEKLASLIKIAMQKNERVVGITHSYLLDENDFHYERDGLTSSIYERLEEVLKEVHSALKDA